MLMNRLQFELCRRFHPETKVSRRSWSEQKTRAKLARAIRDRDATKERKARIDYLIQKINSKTSVPLSQEDIVLILDLNDDELVKLPGAPTCDKKYYYCAELSKDMCLNSELKDLLMSKAAEYIYGLIKSDIEGDNAFKTVGLEEAFRYLSQHEVADILTFNTNNWTYPYGQLDTLAKWFGSFHELDPLEYAKKFERQVGIRGRVYQYGEDPIALLIRRCKFISPKFEKYLIEKGYEKELNERRESDPSCFDGSLMLNAGNNGKQSYLSQEKVENDRSDIEFAIDERNKKFEALRKLAEDSRRYTY